MYKITAGYFNKRTCKYHDTYRTAESMTEAVERVKRTLNKAAENRFNTELGAIIEYGDKILVTIALEYGKNGKEFRFYK